MVKNSKAAAETNLGTSHDANSGENPSTNSNTQSCCICFKLIGNDDVTVSGRAAQCQALAHYSCAGYTVKGARRAKFLCSSCRAVQVLTKSPGKGGKSPTTSTGSSAVADNSNSATPCLCPADSY